VKKIKGLEVPERVQAGMIFPERLNRAGMKLAFKFEDEVKLTEKEIEKIELTVDGAQVRWNVEKATFKKDVLLEDAEYELLMQMIKERKDFPRVKAIADLLDKIEKAEDYTVKEEKK